jgi:hypothetical protein
MSLDTENPQVIAYRLTVLETKVDSIGAKLDNIQTEMTSSRCPSPGSCVVLLDAVKRMEALQEKHETRLLLTEKATGDLRKTFDEKSNFLRGAIWVAGGVGSAAGLVIPALFTFLKGLLIAGPKP